MREFLRLSRVHTASLTIPGVLLGAYLAGLHDPWTLTPFGFWALIFHSQGFLSNNLEDLEYDKSQAEEKGLFPLVRGTITPGEAWTFFYVQHVLMWALGLALIFVGNGFRPVPQIPLAFLALVLAVLTGFAYNHTSKRTTFAPVYICTSFASLPLYAYWAAGGGAWGLEGWYLFAYGWLLMLPQIAVSGAVKDLEDDPVNLMRDLGAEVRVPGEGRCWWGFSLGARAWAWGARLPSLVLAFLWTASSGGSLGGVVVLVMLVVLAHMGLLQEGWMPRGVKVRWMAVEEVLVYWLLVVSLLPSLGVGLGLGFMVGPFLWFVALNLVMWNQPLAPRV